MIILNNLLFLIFASLVVCDHNIYDRDSLITCREIFPPRKHVHYSSLANGGCKLMCGVAPSDSDRYRDQAEENFQTIFASFGSACGLNGFCDKIGRCIESQASPFGNMRESYSLCRRQFQEHGTLLNVTELGGGCEILCERTGKNYTLQRGQRQVCGPQRVCYEGKCVFDTTSIENNVNAIIDSFNGTRVCAARYPETDHGIVQNFGCLAYCTLTNGTKKRFSLNNGKQCHFASHCYMGNCEGATELRNFDYAILNKHMFMNDMQVLLYDEFMKRGPETNEIDPYLYWRKMAVNRTLPYFRLNNYEIQNTIGNMGITPIRNRMNYLVDLIQPYRLKSIFRYYSPVTYFGPEVMISQFTPSGKPYFYIPGESVWFEDGNIFGFKVFDCEKRIFGKRLCPTKFYKTTR